MIGVYLLIAASLLCGAWLLYWRKKRKFDRRNEHGIESFGSYQEKIKADTFDTLLLWAGYASFISGVFMLLGITYTSLGLLLVTILAIYHDKEKAQVSKMS